jgi:hypothetical protein
MPPRVKVEMVVYQFTAKSSFHSVDQMVEAVVVVAMSFSSLIQASQLCWISIIHHTEVQVLVVKVMARSRMALMVKI